MSQVAFFFITAFLVTKLIELVPFALFIKRQFKHKLSVLLLINMLTLPLLWLILPFFYLHYLAAFLVAEALVIVAEAALIKLLLNQTALTSLKTSVLMNVLSAAIGLILF